MSVHLLRDLESLKREILALGAMVQEAVDSAALALVERRPELAEEVIAGDERIDQKDLEIEELGLKILALHQPVAADLRDVVAFLKVSGILETMGDKAAKIAKASLKLSESDPLQETHDLRPMAQKATQMVHASLDALVGKDPGGARQVCRDDDEVDKMQDELNARLKGLIARDATEIEQALRLIDVCRHFERIADLAANIAEDVVFMVEGQTIRHGLGV
jgi:phosphate transport system protein